MNLIKFCINSFSVCLVFCVWHCFLSAFHFYFILLHSFAFDCIALNIYFFALHFAILQCIQWHFIITLHFNLHLYAVFFLACAFFYFALLVSCILFCCIAIYWI